MVYRLGYLLRIGLYNRFVHPSQCMHFVAPCETFFNYILVKLNLST